MAAHIAWPQQATRSANDACCIEERTVAPAHPASYLLGPALLFLPFLLLLPLLLLLLFVVVVVVLLHPIHMVCMGEDSLKCTGQVARNECCQEGCEGGCWFHVRSRR